MRFWQVILWVVVSLGVLSQCSDNQLPPPENLIEEPQMIDVLADICKVEARFQRRLTIGRIRNDEMVLHNYKVVFDKHGITMEQFKKSYEYYEQSPVMMQQIYDSVIVHLTEEQALLKQVESPADSTAKVEYK